MGNAFAALRDRLRPRGIRVYGVGAAKTGTHSLGTMFASRAASAHEADAERLIERLLAAEDRGDRAALRRYLRIRDARRRLRVDASQVNVYLLDDLLALYPDSRFVLTIRPPMAWLRSIVDDSLRRDVSKTWIRFRDYRFGRPGPFPAEEAVLEERGLFQLAGYLSYWSDAIARVTDRVPAGQLMVVRVDELAARSEEIAAFCGIPAGPLGRTHAFANPRRFGLLSRIPAEHLMKVAEAQCGAAFRRHFPERDLGRDVHQIREADTAAAASSAASPSGRSDRSQGPGRGP